MTLTNLIPWGRKPIPIRRSDENGMEPTLWVDLDSPLREMERLFDRFIGFDNSPFAGLSTINSQFVPSLDVHESDKEFQIKIELPGMDEKDIDVSMSRNMLTISGEKKLEKEENAKGIYRMERQYGSFRRSIPLPENGVDTEKAEASYKSGVLTVRLPKTADYKASARKIPVVANKVEEPQTSNGQSS
jgi:HSP20 family protein